MRTCLCSQCARAQKYITSDKSHVPSAALSTTLTMFARNSLKAFKAPFGARGIAIVRNELPPVLRRAMLYGEL